MSSMYLHFATTLRCARLVSAWPDYMCLCRCCSRAVGWNVTTLSPRRWSTRHSTIERVLKTATGWMAPTAAAVGCYAAVAGASTAAARVPANNTVNGGGIQHHVREKWRGRPDIFLILPLPPASAAVVAVPHHQPSTSLRHRCSAGTHAVFGVNPPGCL